MARTKRAQILMEPEDFARLEELARGQRVSVAALIRAAIHERYFPAASSRQECLERILAMNVPTGEWPDVERDLEEAHGDDVP